MSGVGAARRSADRPAERPLERKTRKVETTSFDLALAQALAAPSGSAPSAAAAAKAARGPSGGEEPAGGDRPEAAMKSQSANAAELSRAGGEARNGKSGGGGVADARTGSPDEIDASPPPPAAEAGPAPSARGDLFAGRLDAASAASPAGFAPQERGAAAQAYRPGLVEGASLAVSAARPEPRRLDAGPAELAGARESAQPREAEARDVHQPALRGGDRITVSFDGEGGVEGRVHLAVVGKSVHTTIVSPDAESARRMREDSSSLQRSLAEAGFQRARVTVRNAGRSGANRRQ